MRFYDEKEKRDYIFAHADGDEDHTNYHCPHCGEIYEDEDDAFNCCDEFKELEKDWWRADDEYERYMDSL